MSNIIPAQAGNYQVVVTNATSRATSAVAVVRVGGAFQELFNTGVGDSQVPLPGGVADGHWQLIQSDDPAYPGPAMYVVSFPPAAWLANSGSSRWVSPGDGVNVAGGTYAFRTMFLLDTLDPANAQLQGNWISDNQGLDIRLNGVSLGLTNSGVLNSFTPFTVTSGFVPGLNTLDFVVSNAPGTGPNPAGLRAELHGAALPLAATAVQLTSLPVNVSTQAQQSACFSVEAVGSGPLTYQWYHGAGLLAGQTNRTLVLTGLRTADAGTYTVVVSNSLGSTNASAELTVNTPPLLAWLGLNGSPDWDTGTLNWLNTGSSATVAFSPYADVIFDSRGNSAPMVNVVQPVNPNSITVDSASDYTLTSWSGAGAIMGPVPLVKKNSGALILDVTNNSSGPVSILGGTLQVGNGGMNGTLGSGAVSNDGALVFNRADALVVGNAISGTGAVTNQGYGNTILLGSNSYGGATVVAMGTLSPRHSAALGTTNAGTYVANYAQLFLDVNIDLPGEPLVLRGAGMLGDGALRKGGGGSSTLGGAITLAEDATIKVDGNSTLNLSNAASITAVNLNLTLAGDAGSQGTAAGAVALGNGTLTKTGTGTWTLAGTNGAMSLLTVSAGRLTLASQGALGNSPGVAVSPAATLALSDGSLGANSALSLTCDVGSALRSYLAAAAGTNRCAAPISLSCLAADGKGDVIFIAESASAALDVSGTISGSSLTGSLLLRGAGLGQISGRVNLPNASVNKTDGSLWTVSSTGNTWTNTTVASGMLRLGVNQALPANVIVRMGQGGSTGILDLAGFNQQIGGLIDNGGTEVIASSSTTADSLLTLQSAESWGYSGAI
ncbi:MAG TPA: hypothetical protein VNT26_06580, partial [Candidatus Sulfotelmatobacter sp.]|nr:hypothetical protein [Candidatus Sulfotelmatobacter sp.]